MGFFSNYYMHVLRCDDTVLHLRRNPTWRSAVLFIVLWGITHFVSFQSPYPYLGYMCYILGIWFSYIATEKYEECIFNKKDKTITMVSARFLEKHTLGYVKKLVSELGEVVAVAVESVKPTIFGEAHQVVLLYVTGLTLSVTGSATYASNKSCHQEIADRISDFLDIRASRRTKDHVPRAQPRKTLEDKKDN